MTTTPRSQFHHSQLLLLLLGAILLVIHAATAEKQKQAMTRPACPGMCGNISIPFPFGIGPGCFRDGFEVLCKQSSSSSDLPRAFLAAANTTMEMGYSNDSRVYTREEQIELVSISVATAEARAYAAVSYLCATDGTGSSLSTENALHLASTLFAVSANSNVFIGLGWKADAQLSYYSPSELFFSCRALDNEFNSTWADKPGNGTCTGGCCQAPVERLGNSLGWSVKFLFTQKNEYWETHPCSYSMLVEKSGYSYSLPDISGNMRVPQRFPRGTPFVLDFAAGDASCPAEGRPPPQDYACVSGNSSCANATYTTHARYVCKCWPGYDGNPYMPDGCQDIDECTAPQNPCTNGGDCQNKVGGYDCPCKPGMRDDGKGGSCTLVFPLAARAAVGAIGGILLMVITLFLFILHKEKKKTKEFYKRNGGPILEKADVIKLFKKGELKPIVRSSNLIGKGCFGEVYKGLLHDKLVAIKKPINGTVLESEQFANEVIIQSRVIHKNIVRLIGCCLEVDAPMLVYEFISQGSLHDILHNINYKVPLNLSTRLSIAAQSADGLAYMHSKANITILHGDVKPANILLNDNFEPKVADFGISRLIQRDKEHTGAVIGDMNYMDPVYLQEGLLTEKSDVYSFGIVILELISRRRAIHSERNSLVKGFVEVHKKHKTATEFFDKEIALKENLDLLDSLAGMAVECLSLDADQRPTMMEVAERLLILGRSRKV